MGCIGDELKDLQLCLYTDADFARDRGDLRSISNVFLSLIGTHSFRPLCGHTNKQTNSCEPQNS